MAPHCDTMDGPVVKAARLALEKGNVNLVLPWVQKESEGELRKAFDRAMEARNFGNIPAVTQLIDLWFYETAVRLHRQGEGQPYSGLKPTGLDEGPVVPMADRAIETGDAKETIGFLTDVVKEELTKRFAKAMSRKEYDVNDVDAARQYVQAVLGFVLYSHHLYEYVKSGGEHGTKEEKHRAEIIKKAAMLGHYHDVEKEIEM